MNFQVGDRALLLKFAFSGLEIWEVGTEVEVLALETYHARVRKVGGENTNTLHYSILSKISPLLRLAREV